MMQPDNEGNLLEIIDLAHTLRQEQLFIQHEQASFVRLSETFSQNSASVAKLGWICAQHRQNLNDLIITRTDTGPSVCCHRANRLENTKFIDAYKAKGLKYQHVISYIKLFNYLYRSPFLLAQTLAAGDRITKITIDQINSVVHTISTGLYGNSIHSKDVEMVLKLLRELIEIQIVVSENPRRMLRAGSSVFARLYHRLLESLFSAKIFLTAALHEPIMSVLVKSENMLDIDPNKTIMNLSSKEKLKRFGEETASDYNINIEKYRNETVNNLFLLANKFLENLIRNWSLFPSTLRWLVQTMYHQLKQAHINDKDINEIITDMVFTHFICPAIVSPDIFGISDAPISEPARFNLIQIGQIIQMLALMKYEDVDPKFSDVYQKFDTCIVTNLLDQLLVSENGDEGNGVVAIRSQQSDCERVNILLTHNELSIFIDYFRIILEYDELSISGDDRRKLGEILDILPDKFENIVNGDINSNTNSPQIHAQQNESSNRAKQSLINLGKSTKNKLAKTISLNMGSNQENDENLNGLVSGLQNGTGNSSLNQSTITTNHSNNNSANSLLNYDENEHVLVFPISITDENKLQLLTEEEVLKMNSIGQEIDDPVLIEKNIEKLVDKVDSNEFDEMVSALRPSHGKQTRFSLSHDDASIGNSDNLEAVSEAPSNHSVTSSLELEENDQNDNLSDMVSANVSGRGTPNISGRDTPSSQVTDGDNVPQIPTPQMAKIINKARSDIEDKFCKFEIKKLIEGDETISIISDTWSTDVLASDSETLDANERDRNFSTPLIPSSVVLPGDNNFDVLSNSRPQGNYLGLDASETRSESAWSTDVLVSDSEKLLAELDTDDNLSITAKSDTTDAGRSEGESAGRDIDNLTPNQSNQNDTPDSPFFAPRNQIGSDGGSGSVGSGINVNFQTPDSPVYTARSVESPFFPNTNSYEDPARENQRFISPISSLARSSVRTTNSFSGENNFQQNYKSGCAERSSYLTNVVGGRMRRQNSGESSTSNQSLNMDDNFIGNGVHASVDGTAMNSKNRKEKFDDKKSRKSTNDLIDFNDFEEEEGAAGLLNHVDVDDDKVPDPEDEARLRENEDYRSLYEKFSEEHVIHRRTSSEQRNASFDGRRNGMSTYKPGESIAVVKSRRHQSMNYENHEIIIKKATQRITNTSNRESAPIVTSDIPIDNSTSSTPTANGDGILIEPNATVDIIEPELNGNTSENSLKTSKSTGAIPKSISFDASADKSSRNLNARRVHDPLKLNGTGFFNKIKQGFKNRRQNKARLNQDEFSQRNVSFGINIDNENCGNVVEIRRLGGGTSNNGENGYTDMTEDILAKYRRKVSTSSETTNSDSTGNSCSVNRKNSDIEPRMPNGLLADKAIAFVHAKKKIRTVLSTTDLHTGDFRHTTYSNASPLLTYLQIQLAQALNLQNFKQISYVSEAIRTLNTLDLQQHQKLIEELQGDILKRQSYLQYLMRYRQNLLSTLKNIDEFEERLRSDREMCNRHLIGVCVRMFLEKREPLIEEFQIEFCQLTVVDEKIDLLQEFMDKLINELRLDGIIYGMVDWQIDEARISIERILLQRLYKHVMFPNDDGDISRDEVLYEHIRKLQKIITPSHTSLRIPQEYLGEAPWQFAQEQISYISAYKTPREKLQCVIRCISSILNLLCMACDRTPAADDLLPVLIYVVIKANPPYLLSTIQYVHCFIGNELDGEDEFHWTQFCSVVQFIKTLDYSVDL